MIIKRIKDGFMWVTIQIFNTALDTLETRNIRFHSVYFYATGCVANVKSTYKRNVLYTSKIMSKFSITFHL